MALEAREETRVKRARLGLEWPANDLDAGGAQSREAAARDAGVGIRAASHHAAHAGGAQSIGGRPSAAAVAAGLKADEGLSAACRRARRREREHLGMRAARPFVPS